MRVSNLARQHNELFVAQEFVRWYAGGSGALRPGAPPEADVIWTWDQQTVGIEVTDALFGDADAEQLYGSLRSRVAPADAFVSSRPLGVAEGNFLTASSSHGLPLAIPVVGDPLRLAARLSEVGESHCGNRYASADSLFLILNGGSRPLLRAPDAQVVVGAVTLKTRGPFDAIYVCLAVNEQFDRVFVRIR